MDLTLPGDLRVLIVDDSKSATILIKQQLASLGIAHECIFIATDYRQAIKAVETHAFHVLLIDYHLEQSFTGFELLGILYRNRLIDHTVATILLSGDMRQETVLTALSGEAHHFISKPINTQALGKKIKSAVFESRQIDQLNHLYPITTPKLLKQALEITSEKSNVQFEATLIEHLIAGKKWQLLSSLITHSKTNMHPTKLVAEALILDSLGKPNLAIEKLHNYLIVQPLSLNVIDCLSCIYEKHNMLLPALKLAIRAFEMTPSISHRAIRAIDLAENADNTHMLIKLGEMYASHISPADIDVIHSIRTHFDSLKATYQRETQVQNKRLLLEHANQFTELVNLKLPATLQQQVLASLALFHSNILLIEGSPFVAHKKVIRATTLLANQFYNQPTSLLSQLLPLLCHFGEYSLYHIVEECLKSRGETINDKLESHKDDPSNCINIEDSGSLQELRDFITNYPYSVAAKLDYLYAVNNACVETNLSDEYVEDLIQLDLPPRWNQWISDSSKYGYSTKPPSPFSTCSRQESIC
ncbi:response regulator [Vibrio chagasii]|uniref:response regulator n=1 Tax=Vibrio chagasii TaxID=170679 RepID=UPI001EFD7329|nr:response regulator [Vibrio chagasii]MCG9674046.1 response regulator [Vibrio chagasii]